MRFISQLYTLFLDRVFQAWLRSVWLKIDDPASCASLDSELEAAGVETLFSIDVLKQMGESKYDSAFKSALSASMAIDPQATLVSLPKLFEAYLQAIKRHKSGIFSQGSNNAAGPLNEQVQAAGMEFYALCDVLVAESTGQKTNTWRAYITLLSVIDDERLYNSRREESILILKANCARAVVALTTASHGRRYCRNVHERMLIEMLSRGQYNNGSYIGVSSCAHAY